MFTKHFDKYVCEGDTISCSVDGFDVTARVYHDDCGDAPDERDDGFWPSLDQNDAGYIGDKTQAELAAEMAKAENVMRAWKADEWFYCGVALTVSRNDIQITRQYQHALWGVDCNYPDSDNSYLMEVANDLLNEALDDARDRLRALCAC